MVGFSFGPDPVYKYTICSQCVPGPSPRVGRGLGTGASVCINVHVYGIFVYERNRKQFIVPLQ